MSATQTHQRASKINGQTPKFLASHGDVDTQVYVTGTTKASQHQTLHLNTCPFRVCGQNSDVQTEATDEVQSKK